MKRLLGALPFLLCHIVALAALFIEGSVLAWILCFVLYAVRMWGVTAGYHRYFSHRAFKTGRGFQFALAWLAQSSAQKGVLWWAAHHRDHHKHSDSAEDVHSPVQHGFWHAHLGWLFEPKNQGTDMARVRDLARFPELRFLNRFHLLPPIILALICYAIDGLPGLIIGFFVSTVLLWHGTFLINSMAHVFGRRRYATKDDSRNSALLAAITLGEGWHNNHHRYAASAKNGFFKGEFDPTYLVLRGLERLGLVHSLRPVPERVLEEGRRADAILTGAGANVARIQSSMKMPQSKPSPSMRRLEGVSEPSASTR
ncbi:MAG: acyl-CoA desaturase [Myxococcota bacterium]